MKLYYSPTRVDLAGGTLDLWPIYLFVGDCVTVNLAIDIFTGAELEFTDQPEIEIHVSDLNFRGKYKNLDACLAATDGELKLVQAVIRHFKPDRGFRLKTFSRSPVGGGLGGSSSLCISLIKGFAAHSGKKLEPLDAVHLAHNIEAQVLKTPTGTQDYIPAVVPGLHAIHYSAAGIQLEQLNFPFEHFASHMMLVYTGKSHHSGINNWQVYKALIEGDDRTLAILRRLADISERVAKACRTHEWAMLPSLFAEECEARISLSSSFASPEIETLKDVVLRKGADAVKICGAGGGGCVLVWADPDKHRTIEDECRKSGFQPLKVRPVDRDHIVPPKSG